MFHVDSVSGRRHRMFDKTHAVNGRSTRSLLVSLAIHGALAIALFAVHFTVKSEITRRSARVQLIAPAAPLNRKHVAVRAPARPPEFHPVAKLPALSLPAQPPAPRLQAPPVVAETAPKPQPIPPSQPAVPAGKEPGTDSGSAAGLTHQSG